MIFINDFYKENFDFNFAAEIVKNNCVNPVPGDLLEGMKAIQNLWKEHCESPVYEDDDEFFERWSYEINSFNTVFEGMSKLFA